MNLPTIAIIILHYKNLDDTRECLASLQKIKYGDFSVFVVNNDSQEHAQDLQKEYGNFIKIIQNESNLGFAAGNNAGICAALADAKTDAVLILNNDTTVEPDFLAALATELARDAKTGMVAARMMQYHDRAKIDNLGIVFMSAGLPFNRLAEEDKLFCPSAGCALYSRKLLEQTAIPELSVSSKPRNADKVYYFDPRFFAYAEDLDLGFRGRLAGFEPAYAASAIVYHKGSSITGKLSDFALYHTYRNLIWVYYKNFPKKYLFSRLLYIIISWKILFLYHLIKLRPLPIVRAFFAGISKADIFRPDRNLIQKNTKAQQKNLEEWFAQGLLPESLLKK